MPPTMTEGAMTSRISPLRAGDGGLVIAVAISNAIESFYLDEVIVDGLELFAQPLDVAVDRAVIDIDVLAIGAVHQLIAALDVARAQGERLQDEKFGHRQIDIHAPPTALVAGGIEQEIAALDHRFAIAAAARQLAATQQRPDALDEEAL